MSRRRTAGLSALSFAILILSINLIENVGTARPDPAASAEDVAAWAAEGGAYLWATTILVPICWFVLVIFSANVWTWARSEGIDMLWPTIGVLGAAMTMGTLSAAVAADAALIASVENLPIGVVEFVTGFSTVLFIVNWVALALALLGLSRTTRALDIAPVWLDRLSLVGVILLVAGSTQSGPVLHGFLPGVLLGLGGFVVWLIYLAVVGGRLVLTARSGPVQATAQA